VTKSVQVSYTRDLKRDGDRCREVLRSFNFRVLLAHLQTKELRISSHSRDSDIACPQKGIVVLARKFLSPPLGCWGPTSS
jgi:hypothetical protein